MSALCNYCKGKCSVGKDTQQTFLSFAVFATAAHGAASTSTLPVLLYQRENNSGKNLGSVPECNKRCVLWTIKFEILCSVCIAVNQYSNVIKNLYSLPSSVANNNSFIWLARENISCLLCSGKTALGFVTGKCFQGTCCMCIRHTYIPAPFLP